MKTLMIIGAGAEQVPAYKLAKDRGLKVVGTDMDPSAPASKFADYFLNVSTRDIERTVDEAKKFNLKNTIHGVMTIANDVPLTVASVANALGLNSISIESAMIASNKLSMKEKFREFNVPSPNYMKIKTITDLEQAVSGSNNRFVLKPTDGCGAKGVVMVSSNDTLKDMYEYSKSFTTKEELILEEFMEGMQLSTESFLIDGKAYTPAISERNYEKIDDFYPNIIEDGGTLPAPINDEIAEEVNRVIELAAKSIGVYDGIIKGDLVIDSNSNVNVIEIATRLSGGWFCSHQIPAATGVNLVEANIDFALGNRILQKNLIPTLHLSTTTRYFFINEGKILNIEGEKDLLEMPSLLLHGFFKKIGDYQPKISKHSDRFGYVICMGKDRVESLRNTLEALSKIKVETSN